ncbi:MAG: class I SAM-dependent methyltransferase [Hyphomicrobiales bacterium]|nr:class I SAM-dependent methyltransferase [Hyphomicrobiales bacterium]
MGGRHSVSPAFDAGASAALMDRIYRRQRHIYDATRKFYLLGRDGLLAGLSPPPGASVLEIGCGTGRNLIKLANTYPDTLCHGLDVSVEMLDTAERAIERAGLGDRIRLAKADATSFDPVALFGRASFDRVVISYALSMIPSWREALAKALDCLSARGSLHVIDFGDQTGLPIWFRLAFNRWLALFHVTARWTLAAELARRAHEKGLRCKIRNCSRGYALHAVLDASMSGAAWAGNGQVSRTDWPPLELLHLSK